MEGSIHSKALDIQVILAKHLEPDLFKEICDKLNDIIILSAEKDLALENTVERKLTLPDIRKLLIAYHESQMPKVIESYSLYIEKCVDDFFLDMEELIKLQKEYIEFLGQCYDNAILIASIHHYRETRENIDKGEMLREKIKLCEGNLFNSENGKLPIPHVSGELPSNEAIK